MGAYRCLWQISDNNIYTPVEIPRVRSCKPFCSYDLEVHDPPWLQNEVPTPAILLQNGDREFANDFVLPIWLHKFRYKMTLGPRDPTSIFIQKTSATKWYLDDGPPLASTYLHFSHACLCKNLFVPRLPRVKWRHDLGKEVNKQTLLHT